ncbi:hypothetical protein H310_13827 [Aphanomyces invadans]|uniref:Uncharacterized protein n=1 Tax=Aphanomyces invadans TaxID=157072 RepID=A0A024TCM9_9STRA|nr:hypothetical protein H310_13827 [Aphanomyces invadans]ETV91769.1 hypothetical protein H310_13827 [Aphanomyces invadans]|eukprot:XP_008879695.1 hypothetical protein H310_13827 [Aphanomyces invadans]
MIHAVAHARRFVLANGGNCGCERVVHERTCLLLSLHQRCCSLASTNPLVVTSGAFGTNMNHHAARTEDFESFVRALDVNHAQDTARCTVSFTGHNGWGGGSRRGQCIRYVVVEGQ